MMPGVSAWRPGIWHSHTSSNEGVEVLDRVGPLMQNDRAMHILSEHLARAADRRALRTVPCRTQAEPQLKSTRSPKDAGIE